MPPKATPASGKGQNHTGSSPKQSTQASSSKNSTFAPSLTPDLKMQASKTDGGLSMDEQQQYRQERRCFYCHTSRHISRACPKNTPPTQTTTHASTAFVVSIPPAQDPQDASSSSTPSFSISAIVSREVEDKHKGNPEQPICHYK